MRKLPLALFAIFGGIALTAATAVAQDSGPLIDMLVKKGLINDQEAEEVRADLTKDFASTPAGKLNLSSGLTELRIAGDVRARYESRTGELVTGDHEQRDRLRYRFRAGLLGKLYNDWAFGFRLETASGNRSSNVTMGDDTGPWNKGASGSTKASKDGNVTSVTFPSSNDAVYVGQIWAQWTPTSDLKFTVGRMANPLVSTLMVWDGDINPEGFAEQYKHRVENFEYSATLGQFLYGTNGKQIPYGTNTSTHDLWLFAWQTGAKYYVDGPTKFLQINPTLYTYYRNNSAQTLSPFNGQFKPGNNGAVNDLLVVDMPFEYDWTVGGTPMRAFGDVAVNLEGSTRAKNFSATASNDNVAYHAGIQYGKAVNKGEWDAKVFYQSIGAFALDANLVDSDLFDSRTNMQGWVVSGNYAIGAATQISLTLADASRKNSNLIAPGSGDIEKDNALKKYRLLQVDLNLKF